MFRLLLLLPLLLPLFSCAEKPDGVIVMNEETIENFFEKDKQSWNPPAHLNLLLDQPVAAADLQAPPPGCARICGVLNSDGPYEYEDGAVKKRGSSFSRSVFGKLGPAGDAGNAWFYADYDPSTGRIVDARAYIYGFMGGVCDMRAKTLYYFGAVNPDSFTLNVNGPCLFPQVSGSTSDYALLVQGSRLNPASGDYQLRYVIDDSERMTAIPPRPHDSPRVYDAGDGKAWRE